VTVSNFLTSTIKHALISRGDDLAVRDLVTRVGHAVIRVVLALKMTGLDVAPGRLAERLDAITSGPLAAALEAAETLLADLVWLVQAHTDADIAAFREAMAERRRAIDPRRPSGTDGGGWPTVDG
jgi:hypothetical protein